MSTFYEIDSSRVSLKEYWWGTKSPAVLIGWAIKFLRIRVPSFTDDPNTESTLPFVVEHAPAEVFSTFAPLATELAGLGFFDPVYHVIHDPGTRTTIYWATYRHQSGNYFARIHQRIWQQAQKSNRGLFLMFFTEFTDGTFLVSSSGKPDMAAPASIEMQRLPKARCNVLWKNHVALVERRTQQKMVASAKSQADLVAATERHHLLTRDFHLARGVFRPRNQEEQAKADRYAAAVEQGRASGVQNPEIIAELEKLQEPKPAWRGTFWVLAGSIILFLAIGAANWDWKFTLWLIPALFFHEGGHWMAMRIFKYRNLRMFFIPMFGAAVIGRNWNVAGWKKALVSLAGPLPGIALGLVIGIVGMITQRSSMIEAAIILIILNGFNLLPILPLDGGHFMQAILFCRNRWLDVGFRVLAIAALVGLAALGLGKLLIYIVIPMVIYLPVAFKLAKVTDSMRQANLPPSPPGDDRIPTPIADAIASQVTTALPKGLSNKAAAQHTLSVFESLNARPPGIFATIGLLGLYGGGILVAVLSGMLFLVAKEGRLRDFVKAAAHQPRYAYACGSIQSWQGSALDTNDTSPQNVLVTTLNSPVAAKSAFSSFTGRLPQTSQLTLFGQSLVLTLPSSDDAAREQWFDRLQILSTNTFVGISNRPVVFNLNFIAPTSTDASNLESTLRNYFNSTVGAELIPPWSPEAKTPRFQAYERQRRIWKQIDLELTRTWTNADLKVFNQKIAAASKRGSVSEANALAKERQEKLTEIRAATLATLRTSPDFDPQLVDLKEKLSALSYTNHAERTEILRQVAVKLGAMAPAAKRTGFSSSGFVRRNGLLLEINWVSMSNLSAGLPELANWLCDNRCLGIRYEFIGSFGGDDEPDDGAF